MGEFGYLSVLGGHGGRDDDTAFRLYDDLTLVDALQELTDRVVVKVICLLYTVRQAYEFLQYRKFTADDVRPC